MATNARGISYVDSDAHLPPRKRLLAGLKRQSPDVDTSLPSTSSIAGSDYAYRLNNLLRAQLSNPHLSNEEIVETSRFAAVEAAKIAAVARANAEEKAALAAKAIAAARNALELVVTLTENIANKEERCLKRSNMKKHATVRALYDKRKGNTKRQTDEELAPNLHRTINSSLRILRNVSDVKNHNHKRLKSPSFCGKSVISNGVTFVEGRRPSTGTSNGKGLVVEVETESTVKDKDMIMVDLSMTKFDRGGLLGLKNGEVELARSNKFTESSKSLGKKRGRIKKKKLPLSICSFRDQTSPKEEVKSRGVQWSEDKIPGNHPLFSMRPSGDSLMPVEWKCQSFKAPAIVEQNKVMQA